MNKIIGTVTILGPRPLHDWTKCPSEAEIAACGWPEGMDGKTANFLQALVKAALTEQAETTWNLLHKANASAEATTLWKAMNRKTTWKTEAIQTACRFVDATEKWSLR